MAILILVFLSLSLSFYRKKKQEERKILALARQERKEKIQFFCQRAHEMPEKIGQYQIWWARNHEPDKALKKYYV